MRVLFITRKFPPSVGGMQTLCYELSRELRDRSRLSLVAWGGSQRYLPIFLLAALVRAVVLIPARRIEHVHLGDALLSPLGLVLKLVLRRPVTVTVHGLDVTWPFPPYQLIIPLCLSRLDRLLCNSQMTLEVCVRRGVPRTRCVVVTPGVEAPPVLPPPDRARLARTLGRELDGVRLLVTVGRLVRRKGVLWCVREVMPLLPPDVLYLVVGDGPDRTAITQAVTEGGLGSRVLLLGRVERTELETIYTTADLLVMPNVRVAGDMEGFGIVAIEASSYGLPVVGARLEGIRDAVLEGRTGWLVEPEQPEAMRVAILDALAHGPWDRATVHRATMDAFGWDALGARYVEAFEAVRADARRAA